MLESPASSCKCPTLRFRALACKTSPCGLHPAQIADAATEIKAFTNGHVYTTDGIMALSDGAQSAYGGTDWFSGRYAEPATVLEDLVSILHPTSNSYREGNWQLQFLRHVGGGDDTPTFIASSLCADVTQAHIVRATTCEVISSKANSGTLLYLASLQQSTCSLLTATTDDDDNSLSTDAYIGIGVSAGCAAIAVIVLLVVFMKERATNTAVFATKTVDNIKAATEL